MPQVKRNGRAGHLHSRIAELLRKRPLNLAGEKQTKRFENFPAT